MNRVVLLILTCLTVPSFARNEPPTRDDAAVATLQAALVQMGGEKVGPINTARVVGAVAPASKSEDPAGNFTWTVEVSGTGFQFRHEFSSSETKSVFVSGHGKPASSTNGGVPKYWSDHIATATAPVYVPFLVITSVLANPDYTITTAAPVDFGDGPAAHIHVSNDTDPVLAIVTPQEWYFDPKNGLPVRVEFNVPDAMNAMKYESGAQDFANYQAESGLQVPFQITHWLDGDARSVSTISSVELNVPVTESEFDLGDGSTSGRN